MADFKREVLSDYKDGVTDLSRLRSQKDIALYNHAGAQHAQRKLIKDKALTGYSVEGLFAEKSVFSKEDKQINQITKLLKSIKDYDK